MEKLINVRLGHVNGRHDDVVRRLPSELDEVLAEIGLDGLDLLPGEVAIEVHFLREHGLALDDGAYPLLLGEIDDVIRCGVRVLGEEDLASRLLDVVGGHVQVVVEVLYGMGLDLPGAVAKFLPVGGGRRLLKPPLVEAAVERLEVLLNGRVRECVRREGLEILGAYFGHGELAHPFVEQLGEVQGTDRDVLLFKSAADVHQTGNVAGHDGVRAGVADVRELLIEHRPGDVGILDGKSSSKSAAHLGLLHLDKLDSGRSMDELAGLRRCPQLSPQVARLVIGHTLDRV